jgi:hypothetical protein
MIKVYKEVVIVLYLKAAIINSLLDKVIYCLPLKY